MLGFMVTDKAITVGADKNVGKFGCSSCSLQDEVSSDKATWPCFTVLTSPFQNSGDVLLSVDEFLDLVNFDSDTKQPHRVTF